MEEEEKIRIKLEKVPLESERQEIKARNRRTFLTVMISLLCLTLGLILGFLIFGNKNSTLSADETLETKIAQIEVAFDSWLYKNDYEDLNQTLEDQALYGMTTFKDDPYTTYMSVDELNAFADSINMDYVGIGVQYSSASGKATVTRVFKESPAEKAGILVGDIIVSVDGEDIEGLESDEIKSMVVGEEDTPVLIGVSRGGKELSIEVIRGAVDSTVYAYTNDDVVVIEIMSFGETTSDECIKYLKDYLDYSKLIIDLRDDTGGYQTSVLQVAGLFLGDDVLVMTEEFNDGTVKEFETICEYYFDNFEDIVILTDENTASAAEVLTAAIKQQHPNAKQVGTTTYGKGVVQSSLSLADGSCLKLTTSKWLAPDGTWYNGTGIAPDYEVKLHDVFYMTYPILKEDDVYKNDDVALAVKMAELCLDFLDYDVLRTDGYFDDSLELALMEYQSAKELEATGVLDQKTYEILVSNVSYEFSKNPLKDSQLQKAYELLAD